MWREAERSKSLVELLVGGAAVAIEPWCFDGDVVLFARVCSDQDREAHGGVAVNDGEIPCGRAAISDAEMRAAIDELRHTDEPFDSGAITTAWESRGELHAPWAHWNGRTRWWHRQRRRRSRWSLLRAVDVPGSERFRLMNACGPAADHFLERGLGRAGGE